jgi:hypothetical protein
METAGHIEFNGYNSALFNIRARSLNNFVYWMAQIIGSVSIGFLLDQRALSRRLRAFSGWAILMVMVLVVHIWAYMYQKYTAFMPFLCYRQLTTLSRQKLHTPVGARHKRQDGYIFPRLRRVHHAVYFLRFSRCYVANHSVLDHGCYVQRPC